jgi:transposase InsO family protein
MLCALLKLPRSTYYRLPAPHPDDDRLKKELQALAGQWPTYGYRRLTALLRRGGWTINPKRVRRLLRELGLLAEPPPRRVRTTDSNHDFPRYSNEVEGLNIVRPDQVWAADITYIRLGAGFVYLAVLLDVFTRRIRGWQLGRGLDQTLTLTALDRALRQATPQIHHSDQGVQYAALAYVQRLKDADVLISMAEVGCPEQNGYVERLMRTIKEEEVDLSEYRDFADAQRQLGRFLDDVYNRKRIHSALGYLTPLEFARDWQKNRKNRPKK